VILVTGANGFVGSQLIRQLIFDGYLNIIGSVRSAAQITSGTHKVFISGELSPYNDWSQALVGVDTVVHTAARVHVMRDSATDPLSEYRSVNVEGTLNLARQAARATVKRFIFISSIKVNGEQTSIDIPFSADDTPAPQDPYGISKLEAEQALREVARKTRMDAVVIRSPLVYGPGVRANFLSMMRCVYRGIPLPLGAVNNLRSFVALDNLTDLLIRCLTHPAASNQTFLVSDGEDLSVGQLAIRLGRALGRPARLIRVPEQLLTIGATLLGKQEIVQRLCGSLRLDIRKTRRLLEWHPPITVDEGLRRVTEAFLREARL
jgi:nucleoside-diphosphate-sugar epimerase